MKRNTLTRLVPASAFLIYAGASLWSCSSPDSIGGKGSSGGLGGNAPITLAGSTGSGSFGGKGGSTVPPSTSPDGNCGTTTRDTKRALADVLIVLDRSSSMTWSLTADNVTCAAGDASCSTRLAAVVAGVGAVVTTNASISWGLELFTSPDAASCTVIAKPQVAIGANNGDAIKDQLAKLTTASSTPTAAAIKVATDYLKTVSDGNKKVILLATDGEPNCAGGTAGSSDLPGATAAVKAALAAGFPVYVIGIGPSVANLNGLAQEGGTQKYYPATSTAELTAALSSIAQVVSNTCSYKADTVPPDRGLVYVYVDKHLVNKNDSNGWAFDPADPTGATIKLTGSTCDGMLSGATSQVQIVFGCPNTSPPQIIP